MRVLAEIYASVWAIRPEALAAIVAIADRDDVAKEFVAAAMHYTEAEQRAAIERFDRQTVAQRTGTPVDRTNGLLRRGSTAVLPIKGPIVRYGSLFSSMSGAGATVETLAKDLTRAIEDDSFASILLDVDSPGGEASGIGELADMIYAARGMKPIVAYVSDLGASAGYWLASAAEEIVMAPTAAVGSIGCVMAVRDPSATKRSTIEFVSSASPHKRPDPLTESGRAQIQGLVDSLGDLFVQAVAQYRDVPTSKVLGEFGGGGLRVGQDAVDAGMADRLGTFEGTLRELAERTKPVPLPRKAAASTPPAPEPVAAREGERTPPIAASAAGRQDPSPGLAGLGAHMNGFMERLRALVAEADVPDGSADLEAALVTSNLTGTETRSAPTPAPTPTGAPIRAGDDTLSPEVRERLSRLEQENSRFAAENSRLRTARIQEKARAFADDQQRSLRALGPEIDSIVAIYSLLAQDDEIHGPVAIADGTQVLRVTYLANLFAARPSRKDLTDDVLGGVVTHVFEDRARSARERDPNAEPDATRMAELLARTEQGQEVLKALSASVAANR
jgi:capsid assembly protease